MAPERPVKTRERGTRLRKMPYGLDPESELTYHPDEVVYENPLYGNKRFGNTKKTSTPISHDAKEGSRQTGDTNEAVQIVKARDPNSDGEEGSKTVVHKGGVNQKHDYSYVTNGLEIEGTNTRNPEAI